MRWFPLVLLLGCVAPIESDDDDATEEPTPAPVLEHRFSFVVLADPHVVGPGTHADRLELCLEWIEDQRDSRALELVVVVGDIGWSDGLELSKALLDTLSIPYLPVLGDNPIQVGDEEDWDRVFGPHLDSLADRFEGWTRAPVEGWTPVQEVDTWFQSSAFDYRGLRFLSLDWNTRHQGGLLSELADTHDFAGGTLPFLEGELAGLVDGAQEDVLLFSHIPMHVPAFTAAELDAVTGLTAPVGNRVFANFAGHYHGDGHEVVEAGGYEVFVTDATWDDEITLRVVEVWGDGERFEYVQDLVILE